MTALDAGRDLTGKLAEVAGRAFLSQIAGNLLIDGARRDRIVSFDLIADLDLLQVDNGLERSLQAAPSCGTYRR